jgi:hypothetical protein
VHLTKILSFLNRFEHTRKAYHAIQSKGNQQSSLLPSIKFNKQSYRNAKFRANPAYDYFTYFFTTSVISIIFFYKIGPDQVWYFDTFFNMKIKLYNLFSKEKIEIVEEKYFEQIDKDEIRKKIEEEGSKNPKIVIESADYEYDYY